MVSICRWFGSYIQCHLPKIQGIGPSLLARPSKSKQEDWMHTFSSTTPGLGVENNLDNVWDHCSLDDQLGSISHMSRSIHTKCTSTIGLSFTTHWVKTDPKVLCYNPTDGVSHPSSRLWTSYLSRNWWQGLLCVSHALHTWVTYSDKYDSVYIWEY